MLIVPEQHRHVFTQFDADTSYTATECTPTVDKHTGLILKRYRNEERAIHELRTLGRLYQHDIGPKTHGLRPVLRSHTWDDRYDVLWCVEVEPVCVISGIIQGKDDDAASWLFHDAIPALGERVRQYFGDTWRDDHEGNVGMTEDYRLIIIDGGAI